MEQTDTRAWLRSVSPKSHNLLDHSFLSTERLNRTTFSELDIYATKLEKAAYEALPNHTFLRFESVDQETLDLFSEQAQVTTTRLVIGISKYRFRGTGSYKPAYAYIGKKHQAHQILLRLGNTHLRPKDFEVVEWEAPFSSIYTAYGQTERAGDKLSLMAAFYFLAAGRISEIVTRTASFMHNFTKICSKIHVHACSQPEYVSSNDMKEAVQNVWPMAGEKCAPDLLGLDTTPQEGDPKRVADDEDDLRQYTLDLKLISTDLQKNIKEDRSGFGGSSHNSSPTVWEGSYDSPMREVSSNHGIQLLKNEAPEENKKPEQPLEATEAAKAESRAPTISDLTFFVHKFAQLEADNAALLQHQSHASGLQALADKSRQEAQQAHHQLQTVQSRLLQQETETKELRKQLAINVAEAAAKHKEVTYELGREQFRLRLSEKTHEQVQVQLRAVETDNKELKERLAKAEERGVAAGRVASMEAKIAELLAENEGLKEKTRVLEKDVLEEKQRFEEYKRKIRNLSMEP